MLIKNIICYTSTRVSDVDRLVVILLLHKYTVRLLVVQVIVLLSKSD